ncbi:insulinase family protein [Zunongwangia sp. F363]|uniref:Insulinase family protein n=1 Tax=Autumnicola tepida TaxID=3075595 RepID=A0ABU3CE73_9FLAO|nr:insulinase family protein [Zunongwangia sp. F363]MDT0644517.1 insulinase family protein [Zunongwangia sp. F363]
MGNIAKWKSEIQSFFSSSEDQPVGGVDEKCSEKFLNGPSQFLVLESKDQDVGNKKEVIFHCFIRDRKLNYLTDAQWKWIKPILNRSINDLLWNQQKDYKVRYISSSNWSFNIPALDIMIKAESGYEIPALQKSYALIKGLKNKGISAPQWEKIQIQGIQNLENTDTSSFGYWSNKIKEQVLSKKKVPLESPDKIKSWWSNLSLREFNAILRDFIPEMPDDIAVIAPLTQQQNKEYWKKNTKRWIASVRPKMIKPILKNKDSLKFNDVLKTKGLKELPKDSLGSRIFKLSNGLKVVLKELPETSMNKGSINVHGFRNIGALNFPEEDYYTALLSPLVINNAGIENLDKFQLSELLSRNSIHRLQTYISDTESGINGRAQEKDLETFFQMLYKYMSSPRKDLTAFKSWKWEEWQRFLHPPYKKSTSDFVGGVNTELLIPNSSLSISKRYQAVQDIEMDKAYRIYHSIFDEAKEFTFLITSSVESEKLIPLIDRYLGNLPNHNQSLFKSLDDFQLPEGPKHQILDIPTITNGNTIISARYIKRQEYDDWKNRIKIQVLAKILFRKVNQLRNNKKRGIYIVIPSYSNNGDIDTTMLGVTVPCMESEANLILNDIQEIIQEMQHEEITQEELDNFLDNSIIPKYTEWKGSTSKALERLYDYYKYDAVPPQKARVEEYCSSLTPQAIKEAAQTFFTESSRFDFIGKALQD